MTGAGTLPANGGQLLRNSSNILRGGGRGNGLEFPGVNEYVDCGTPSGLQFNNTDDAFTISMILEHDGSNFTNGQSQPFGIGDVSDRFKRRRFMVSDNNTIFLQTSLNSTTGPNVSTYFPYNEIIHVVGIFDGHDQNNWKIYINGEEPSLMFNTNTMLSNQTIFNNGAGTTYIGKAARNFKQNYWGGYIYSCAVFNKVLTASEVETLYRLENNPLAAGIPSGDIIANWQFNERQGGTLKDQGPNGYDGTLVNYTTAEKSLGSDNKHINGYTQNPILR